MPLIFYLCTFIFYGNNHYRSESLDISDHILLVATVALNWWQHHGWF